MPVPVPRLFFGVLMLVVMAASACGGSAGRASSEGGGATTFSRPATGPAAAGNAASAGANSPELTQLIQAANQEHVLQLGWDSTVLGGTMGAKQFQDGMNKLYGTNIQINFTPLAAQAQVAAQMATEYKAGQKAVSDLYTGAGTNLVPLIQQKVLASFDWTKLLPGRITPEIAEQNVALRLYTGIPSIEYNTNLIKGSMVPKHMQDLLAPTWMGKVYTTSYAASFDYLAAPEMWGEQRTLDYLQKLRPNLGGFVRCGDDQRIASGEVPALALTCSEGTARRIAAKGAPVAQVVPIDAAEQRYSYLAIPKNAEHIKAAELFAAYTMTPQGQALVWNTMFDDLDSFPGSHTKADVDQLKAEGAKFFGPSIQYLEDHPELQKAVDDMRNVLIQK